MTTLDDMYMFIYLGLFFWMHLMGDFMFQNRKVATNKSSSVKWLTFHILIYSSFFILTLPLFICYGTIINFLLFLSLILSTHWLTDFITSKIITYFYKKNNTNWFFHFIGIDQWIHTITLLYLFYKFILPLIVFL